MFEQLGLAPGQEHVAILVGPNGSGKSNFLKAVAEQVRHYRDLVVISNTANDRFAGMRGIDRLSAGRSGASPKAVVKRAVARTIDEPSSRFYQIGAILEFCGYQPRFGFRIGRPTGLTFRQMPDEPGIDRQDYEVGLAFLERHDPQEMIWVDRFDANLSYSLSREFAAVLRNEDVLRRQRHLPHPIQVYLERRDGAVIELHSASSGELALISSLVFLITKAGSNPLILIDEPENSLHPIWQRDYVDRVLAAVAYRTASIVIATHAPLVVTGALASSRGLISVFQMQDAQPVAMDLTGIEAPGSSIEEVLWRAFNVITPANHFVSEELMGLVGRLDRREIGQEEALSFVDTMREESFDQQQQEFFGAVRELIQKVGASQNNGGSTDA